MKNEVRFFLVAWVSLCLFSCGAGKDDLASRVDGSEAETTDKPLAECSQADVEGLQVNLKAAYDEKGKWNPDRVYVSIKLSNPELFRLGGEYIQFLREMSLSTGKISLDPDKLRFRLVTFQEGKATKLEEEEWRTALGWPSLSLVRSNLGIDDVGAFFDKVGLEIELRDKKGDYDVLHSVVYKASDNTAKNRTEQLIPLFYASPGDYQYENVSGDYAGKKRVERSPRLRALHPLAGQSMSSSEYKSAVEAFCSPFND